MGIEPTLSAWKAEVLPLNYTRINFTSSLAPALTHSTISSRICHISHLMLVEGEGFEPSKAEPSDLQSDPFDRSGTPPKNMPFSFMVCSKSIGKRA